MPVQSLDPAISEQKQHESQTRAFVIAWFFTVVFYFLEYAVRSSPSVMIPGVGSLVSYDGARHRHDSGHVLLHLLLYVSRGWSGS